MSRRWGFGVLLLLVSARLGLAGIVTTIDFEGQPDGTLIVAQYPGLVFSNAIIATANVSLDPSEFPPESGINVAFDFGGPMTIEFMSPTPTFQAFFTYAVPLTITAFDATNTQVDVATSLFSSNFVSTGNPPNELLSLSSAGGISHVLLSGDPGGTSFTVDDITFVAPAAAVPEPGSIALLASALVLGCLGRRYLRKPKP